MFSIFRPALKHVLNLNIFLNVVLETLTTEIQIKKNYLVFQTLFVSKKELFINVTRFSSIQHCSASEVDHHSNINILLSYSAVVL